MKAATLNYKNTYLKSTAPRGEFPPALPLFVPPGTREIILPDPMLDTDLPLGHVAQASAADHLSLQDISNLAHYTLGLSRYEPGELYLYHRPAPSPRCKHATELWYFTLQDAALPAGLYRYNPIRHTLQMDDLQDWLSILAENARQPQDGWLLSAVPDRLRHIYGDFTSRLMCLEAGHVTEQLQLVHHMLGHGLRSVPFPQQWVWPTTEKEIPLQVLWRENLQTEDTPLPVSFVEATRNRHSAHGSNGVYPLPIRLPLETACQMGEFASRQKTTASLYAVVQNVEGLDPGAYSYLPHEGFRWIAPIPRKSEMQQALFITPGFHVPHCPIVWLISEDTGVLQAEGTMQDYQQTHQDVGRVGQRLGLAAAASGLFARPAVSHDEGYFDWLLRLTDTDETVLYQVLIGQDRYEGWPVQMMF
ncbi:hypothetical protein [Deinococcus cellulosilyticus]|uniref:Uncharacterized protein n=1 Tax=Deinococcus cellulosilyticus (strain DSM 18568 / NBRC 106333 / KACC 11606 / 5516J-15) TaxID=1223518 RepID=A0A511N228_DEIC1|nr:hypothetical protein [Deinococcus cellulosilyticus]GEM46899.1 hypothetical protein DC3_25340 [Deinococcus cellulosilyticus NBRC 106333 = KACC 11606]